MARTPSSSFSKEGVRSGAPVTFAMADNTLCCEDAEEVREKEGLVDLEFSLEQFLMALGDNAQEFDATCLGLQLLPTKLSSLYVP